VEVGTIPFEVLLIFLRSLCFAMDKVAIKDPNSALYGTMSFALDGTIMFIEELHTLGLIVLPHFCSTIEQEIHTTRLLSLVLFKVKTHTFVC
jgi:hypothetical protein